jgi:hypothetical protein
MTNSGDLADLTDCHSGPLLAIASWRSVGRSLFSRREGDRSICPPPTAMSESPKRAKASTESIHCCGQLLGAMITLIAASPSSSPASVRTAKAASANGNVCVRIRSTSTSCAPMTANASR